MKRTREQVVWDFVREWLRKAEGDLRAAEHLLALEQEDYFVTAFHAQQAAEKFLKAFLVRHQIPFPKTHDIGFLLELAAQADPSLPEELASAAMLTPFGVEFRYPGETVADRETARSALQEAHRVKAAVQRRLQAYLAQGRPSGRESS
ncbi:HEPN domain-containing protein [Rhodothermus marinus]|uniref:HEPN domain protein n=1 Tax=Rhodothermus marinus (strain ATCC 43812 / DSM 4252 / R-10) TaxID=518766 RepID=D0MDB3_RHOM4|nr:HEPN domain-containing protein [Rhodothermus marinus]ACY49025.1 HEPN domain protein [Rhodothermus marinus DSM 4252]